MIKIRFKQVKKVIGLLKDESGEKIMKTFAGPKAKTYLMDENAEKSKRNKKVCNKEKTYENYTD